MDQQTGGLIIFILFIVLLMVLAYFGSSFLMKRALKTVIKMFRDHNATTPETAQFTQDMGMKKQGLFQTRGLRDYRPMAVQFMLKHDILLTTDEGKLYLSEEALERTDMENRISNKK